MKKLLLVFVFIVAVAATALAGNGDNNNTSSSNATKILCGKVTDKQTGEILAGVKIKIKDTNNFCYSDLKGNFTLTVSVTEKAEVLAEIIGYNSLTIPTSEVGFNTEIALIER